MKDHSNNDNRLADWTNGLGLLPVPLRANRDDQRFILLNGSRGNFCLDLSVRHPEDPRRDAWSSNVGHYVQATESEIRVTRWDGPIGSTEFWTIASVLQRLAAFHEYLEETTPSPDASVIAHGIRVFRQLRAALPVDAAGDVALQAFLLLLAESAENSNLTSNDLAAWGLDDSARTAASYVKTSDWHNLRLALRAGRPAQQLGLDTSLLIRHAAGPLFEEAHREAQFLSGQQLTLGTLPPRPAAVAAKPTGVGLHFTPPMLARSLVQEGLEALPPRARRTLTIFDPACGSGEFLREALRQLVQRGYTEPVRLVGWDISAAAVAMARFVLACEIRGSRVPPVEIELVAQDSLSISTTWPKGVDLVFMNPPFCSWEELRPGDRTRLTQILGPLRQKRPDVAFAFLLLATTSLATDGALGTVVPASLLSSDSAKALRGALLEMTCPRVIARLGSHSAFPGALVDAGLLVLSRPTRSSCTPVALWADHQPASASRALRALRQTLIGGRSASLPIVKAPFSIYFLDPPALDAESWAPRPYNAWKLLSAIPGATTFVTDVFRVSQGIRSGLNKAFILAKATYLTLPKPEQAYFRPAVVNGSLRAGQLLRNFFVFYPYDETAISSEKHLSRFLPDYYERFLRPNRPLLESRRGLLTERWWELTRPRLGQRTNRKKLVSTYFGDVGAFGWDSDGDFAVVQGFAWLPTSRQHPDRIGLAYLTLLNTAVFSTLLSATSIHVAGGQWDLSPRFLRHTPLPNLLSKDFDAGLIDELAALGSSIAKGQLSDVARQADQLAARSYGIDLG
jgi:adenine-specific DNA-methyltransferase